MPRASEVGRNTYVEWTFASDTAVALLDFEVHEEGYVPTRIRTQAAGLTFVLVTCAMALPSLWRHVRSLEDGAMRRVAMPGLTVGIAVTYAMLFIARVAATLVREAWTPANLVIAAVGGVGAVILALTAESMLQWGWKRLKKASWLRQREVELSIEEEEVLDRKDDLLEEIARNEAKARCLDIATKEFHDAYLVALEDLKQGERWGAAEEERVLDVYRYLRRLSNPILEEVRCRFVTVVKSSAANGVPWRNALFVLLTLAAGIPLSGCSDVEAQVPVALPPPVRHLVWVDCTGEADAASCSADVLAGQFVDSFALTAKKRPGSTWTLYASSDSFENTERVANIVVPKWGTSQVRVKQAQWLSEQVELIRGIEVPSDRADRKSRNQSNALAGFDRMFFDVTQEQESVELWVLSDGWQLGQGVDLLNKGAAALKSLPVKRDDLSYGLVDSARWCGMHARQGSLEQLLARKAFWRRYFDDREVPFELLGDDCSRLWEAPSASVSDVSEASLGKPSGRGVMK
jgi:hypothetical protein